MTSLRIGSSTAPVIESRQPNDRWLYAVGMRARGSIISVLHNHRAAVLAVPCVLLDEAGQTFD